MFKKILLALAVSLPVCAFGQAKFGIVNVDAIVEMLPETLDAKNKIDEASKTYEEENNRLAAEINKKVEEYQALPASNPWPARLKAAAIWILVLLSMSFLVSSSYNPFLYFRF